MRYGSVCSGIEAASAAWNPLGWRPVFFSEIDPFPCAVLSHHHPDVPNLGDMSRFEEWPDAALDVLVGGTPCQSYSVAGLRKGLADPRGNLMLTFGAIARRYRPRWLVWENVPGVLSSNGGRDFGTFLGMLGELGYGFAYRVLDAQFFGVAQRRRRVFVVGCLGDWRRAAAVLFERHSLSGHPAPSREAGEGAAPCLDASFGRLQGCAGQDMNHGHGHLVPAPHAHISPALKARDFKGVSSDGDGDGDGAILVPMAHAFDARQSDVIQYGDMAGPLDTDGHSQAIAFAIQSGALRTNPASGPGGIGVQKHIAYTIEARAEVQAVASPSSVRRLTPRECERLQGFPDDYTRIPYRNKPASQCPDGPRYKALGNSMAVPVMCWIGARIAAVDAISIEAAA